MKPTPRTDANEWDADLGNMVVYSDFARTLERELSDALEREKALRQDMEFHARNGERLAKALSAMLTHAMLKHMGMDQDEWNKVMFDQARTALRLHESGGAPEVTDCPIHGKHEGDCPRC